MKTILVPTDFSEAAANAIEYAAHIATATQRSILILHIKQGKDTDADGKLRIIREALCQSFNDLRCNYLVVPGADLTYEITQTASHYDVDLIVMGTQERSNVEKVIFGTNTAAVIEKAKCMVLSVPFGSGFKPLERILFATNFEHADVHTASNLVALAKPFNASVLIAHINTDPDKEEIDYAKIQIFARELSLLTNYAKIHYRMIGANTVTMGLDMLIESTRADVLAMSTHRRNIIEKVIHPSITQKFAQHSDIPLLAFHSSVEGG